MTKFSEVELEVLVTYERWRMKYYRGTIEQMEQFWSKGENRQYTVGTSKKSFSLSKKSNFVHRQLHPTRTDRNPEKAFFETFLQEKF